MGGGPTLLRSDNSLRANIRHNIRVKRRGSEGMLDVDGSVVRRSSPGNSSDLDTLVPFLYIGHVRKDMLARLPKRLVLCFKRIISNINTERVTRL